MPPDTTQPPAAADGVFLASRGELVPYDQMTREEAIEAARVAAEDLERQRAAAPAAAAPPELAGRLAAAQAEARFQQLRAMTFESMMNDALRRLVGAEMRAMAGQQVPAPMAPAAAATVSFP